MRYWLDTEFIEYPRTIDLISIGIVDENDREFYAINQDCDFTKAGHWVQENVLGQIDSESKFWMPQKDIAHGILEYIGALGKDYPEFWGYYADYDWVIFCWLFGAMIDLPGGWPMYCRDIKQWCDQLGNPSLPDQRRDEEHHALNDAKWNKKAWYFLESYRKQNDR